MYSDLDPIWIILLVIVLCFTVVREIITWYFKQNQIVNQNNEIIRLLRKLANEPPADQSNSNYETISGLFKRVNKKS